VTSDRKPVDPEHADPQPIGSLQLDDVQLPIYDIGAYNAADVRRASSFVTNFGTWQVPTDVATALAAAGGAAALEWIHDTGELVLLGGVPTVGAASAAVGGLGVAGAGVPASLGGTVGSADGDGSGMVQEYFRASVMPAGSRVALLAHVAHGPQIYELLWGWRHEHRTPAGWAWLVERLARLEKHTGEADHLG
jgi:hypothetical protein